MGCPGVSARNHYYCIFGTETNATWFCTCIERTGDHTFHCGTQLPTEEELAALTATEPPRETQPPGDGTGGSDSRTDVLESFTAKEAKEEKEKENGSFVSGLFTGVALMLAGMLAFLVVKKLRGSRRQPVSTSEGQIMVQGDLT